MVNPPAFGLPATTALSDLTEAQGKALDWLPGDGEPAPMGDEVVDTLRSLRRLRLVQMRWIGGDPTQNGFWEANATPSGLALKRERMAQGGGA